MALVINLHGPNTNTLGNLTAGALAEMGYSAVAVPSCRREMELAALSGNEQAIRLTDGSLESCVELASMQAERNRRSIDPDLDAVIVCGPVVDSFWGYKGNREDSFYRAAIETALELDAAQYELVPSGSLTEHTLAQFRSFLRDCGVRPRISGQLDYGYHDIIDIVRSEVALDRKEHPVKGAEKVDVAPDCEKVIAGFKNAAISVQEAIKSLPEGSEMRVKLESMVDRALEDGYGGIHIETVRKPMGKTMSLSDLVQSEVDAASRRSDRDVHFFKYDEQNQRIDYPGEGDAAIMPSDLAAAVSAAYQGKEAAKPEPQRAASYKYTGLTFAPCDMKVKTVPVEDGPDKNFLLCKLPPHTMVGNQDLGGMIVSKFLTDRQLPYAQSGKPFTASFKTELPVRVYPVNGEDSRDNFDYDYRSPQEFSAGALVAGIEDAYDARLLNAQGYEDKLAAAGKEMNPAAAEAKQMLEDRDAAASRQGSKAAALEYHQTGGGEDAPLNDLCDAKNSEAAEVQGDQPYVITGPEPELYDEDVEF